MPECVYLSRRRVEAGEWTMNATVDGVNHNAIPIPAGHYYLDAPAANDSLANQITIALTAAYVAVPETFNTELIRLFASANLGQMQFSCTTLGANWELRFVEQSFAEWVGFVGALGGFGPVGVTPQLSTNVCQGIVVTDCQREGFKGWDPEFGGSVSEPMAGPACVVSNGAEVLVSDWTHPFEPAEYVNTPRASGTRDAAGTTLTWAWVDFFRHHCRYFPGQPFRVWDAEPAANWASYEMEAQLTNVKDFMPEWREPHSAAYWVPTIKAREAKEA